MLVRILSYVLLGVDARLIEVEADVSQGLPSYTVVGLPGGSVRESGDRVRAAIRNSGLPFPARKITINLAPADVRKDGGLLDLAIAVALLCAEGVIPPARLEGLVVGGELSLDGSVKPVRGVLSQGLLAKRRGLRGIVIPAANAVEGTLVPGVRSIPVASLGGAVESLHSEETPPVRSDRLPPAARPSGGPDLEDVAGQAVARRALEIAAAGHHALLLVGPPGCGKTMLAERLPGILPDFEECEALEATQIYSAAGEPPWPSVLSRRPFRAPHPGVTPAGLVGGGNPPRPGEISFAHGGVLFLDELSEFTRAAREALRLPLETGEIRIVRAGNVHRYPCRFLLAAATNPCPCGNAGTPRRVCRCTPAVLSRFARKFSGPLLDRIDLGVAVRPLSPDDWRGGGEPSDGVRGRVLACRRIQEKRYAARALRTNGTARLSLHALSGELTPESLRFLARAGDALGLTGRGLGKVCRVARTIADLAGEKTVGLPCVAEALQYRLPDFAAVEERAPDGDRAATPLNAFPKAARET